MRLRGEARLAALTASLRDSNQQADLARLAELVSCEQERSWIWSINKAVDPCLEPR